MDDGSPIGYLIAILLLIFGGAYFAGSEIALASVNKIRMKSYAEDGNKRAKRVLYILDNFDKALSTLLIGNNIMHISCASIATLMATKLWGGDSVALTTVITTFTVFLIAEMLPKCFAKACNESFAMAIAGSLILLMKLLTPIAFVFTKVSDFVSRPFKSSEHEEPTVTEDELYDIIETIAQEGAIDEEKSELVQSALEFSDIMVKDVLTKWDDVLTVSIEMTPAAILEIIRDNSYSRLPVIDSSGEPIGILNIRRFLKTYMRDGERTSVRTIMDKPHYVGASIPIDELLEAMSSNKTHISIVLDSDASVLGIVTVEDILEELVGEIYDEDDDEHIDSDNGLSSTHQSPAAAIETKESATAKETSLSKASYAFGRAV